MINLTNEINNSLEVLKVLDKQTSSKKDLLDGNRTIYLQISLFKIPYMRGRKRKFLKLRHSLYGDHPDICLFVPNRQSKLDYKISTDELIELTINYYTDFLEKHKVEGIKTIMPIKQLKAEYGVYELRRKLVSAFDLFLCKTSLLYNSRFLGNLGKIFTNAKKDPVGLSFPAHDSEFDPSFNENVKAAIFASSFWIKPHSDNYSIPVGTTSNSTKQLKENLQYVLKQIASENIIPGGFQNIKNIYLWPSQSKTIPIYICSTLPKNISLPVVKSKPSELKNVIGTISTLTKKKVVVKRSGAVIVKNSKPGITHPTADSSNNEELVDGSEEEEEDEEQDDDGDDDDDDEMRKNKKFDSEEDSEEDEKLEKQEQKLLKRNRELIEEDMENSEVVQRKRHRGGKKEVNSKKLKKNASNKKQKQKQKAKTRIN